MLVLDSRDSPIDFQRNDERASPAAYHLRSGLWGCEVCCRRECECEQPTFVVLSIGDVRAHARFTPSGQTHYECGYCGSTLKTRSVDKAVLWFKGDLNGRHNQCSGEGIQMTQWLEQQEDAA